MTKIIELAHALGEEIAKSDEIRALEVAKEAFQKDAELQEKMSKYEAQRALLGQEFSKGQEEIDQNVVATIKASIEELTREISTAPNYIAFAEAQNAVNAIMKSVNDEIKYSIPGERPVECTHDCSTCSGCH